MNRTISYAEVRQRHLRGAAMRARLGLARADKVHDEEQFAALVRLAKARQAREQRIILPTTPGEPRRIVWTFPAETVTRS
jgi:hypothetical protein